MIKLTGNMLLVTLTLTSGDQSAWNKEKACEHNISRTNRDIMIKLTRKMLLLTLTLSPSAWDKEKAYEHNISRTKLYIMIKTKIS